MHIMEGFLPPFWAALWFALALPIVAYGVIRVRRLVEGDRELLPLLAVSGAFIFVLSSLKLPSVTGSSSHPTGTGSGAVLFGPAVTSVLATIVLVYQALFLAHGGFSTLGANVFSMGIAGPAAGYAIYRICMRARVGCCAAVFATAFVADIATYLTTSAQLALAFPATTGGVLASFLTFAGIFALTQLPLAVVEGLVIALVFRYMIALRGDVLERLHVLRREAPTP
jgi:cobalt/nickel transport system permease protein